MYTVADKSSACPLSQQLCDISVLKLIISFMHIQLVELCSLPTPNGVVRLGILCVVRRMVTVCYARCYEIMVCIKELCSFWFT
jgi:hypothetical protein